MRLLIADDDPDIRDMFGFLLDSWGYEADTAKDGQEALEKAKTYPYDLCIFDIDMPRLNGIETAKRIRGECSFVPIMAFTARHEFIKKECLAIGMNDFMSKPGDIHKLQEKIKELTVKTVVIKTDQGKVKIGERRPMDEKELMELRGLRKKGLGIFMLRGTRDKFVTHINVQNKVSYDFAQGKILSEFLDRSEETPGNVHLYQYNMHANQKILLPEEMEERIKTENNDMQNYEKKFDKRFSEDS